MSIEHIQALSSIVANIVVICGLGFALYQVYQIKVQLKTSTLTNVLSIEAELNSRKEKLDAVSHEIEILHMEGKLSDKAKEIYERKQNATIENWLNSVDRLCFCIKRDYLKEKDWKAEYRDYIIDIVKNFEKYFGAASRYKNIMDINEKWLRE
jgi:uncharacterized protein HemX